MKDKNFFKICIDFSITLYLCLNIILTLSIYKALNKNDK